MDKIPVSSNGQMFVDREGKMSDQPGAVLKEQIVVLYVYDII